MFVRRKLYQELGGYPGVKATPLRELQECRLSIIAEMNIQAEETAELKEQQATLKRKQDMEALKNRRA